MDQPTWILLNSLVFGTARTLQDGLHTTAEDWSTIAEDLTRAAKLAEAEANTRAMAEDGAQPTRRRR